MGRRTSAAVARRSARHLSVGASFLLALLAFTSADSPAAAAAPGPTPAAAFNLDGVNLSEASALVAGTTFLTPKDDGFQMATAAAYGGTVEVQITAVRMGTASSAEGLPVATPGGASAYLAGLQTSRQQDQGGQPSATTLSVFGAQIPAIDTTVVVPSVPVGRDRIIEGVAEASQRLWIVRYSLQLDRDAPGKPSSSTWAAGVAASSLSAVGLADQNTSSSRWVAPIPMAVSPTVARFGVWGSPDQPSRFGGYQLRSANFVGTPGWWSGTCDDGHYFPAEGAHAYTLGSGNAVWNGLRACGPRPIFDPPYADYLVHFYSGAWGEYEWECVELSMRWLYLEYGQAPYGADGKQVVSNYPGTKLAKISNPTIGQAPAPGDVLSYGSNTVHGHTSVVTASSVNASGNGSITVIEQNNSSAGVATLTVTNWTVNYSMAVSGWLHDGAPTTPPPAINSLSIARGWTIGGTAVTITGSHFSGASSVKFGGTAVAFTVISDTQINTTSPAGAVGRVDVTVTTPVGTSPTNANDWFSWYLPGIAAVVSSNGNRDIAGAKANGSLWHDWATPSGAWNPADSPNNGFGVPASQAMTASAYNGNRDFYSLSSDGTIWHTWATATSGWNLWDIPGSGFTGNVVATARASDGRRDLYAMKPDGSMWHTWATANGTWYGWDSPNNGVGIIGSQTATVSPYNGTRDLYVLAPNGTLYHTWAEDSGPPWYAWDIEGYGFAGNVVATVSAGTGQRDIYTQWPDGRIFHASAPASGASGSWESPHDAYAVIGTIAATSSPYNSNRDLYYLTGGTVYHTWGSGPSGWSGVDSLGSGMTGRITATTSGYNGNRDAFMMTTSGALYHKWAGPSSGWSLFASPGGGFGP